MLDMHQVGSAMMPDAPVVKRAATVSSQADSAKAVLLSSCSVEVERVASLLLETGLSVGTM